MLPLYQRRMNIETNFTNQLQFFYIYIYIFFLYLFRSTVYPAGFLRIPSLLPPITPYPHFAKLPNCRCVRRRLSYTAPHLPRTRGNCGKPVSVQTTMYFSDSSMPAIKESEELASRSMTDVQVNARLSGHPSKYWLRAALLDFGDHRSRAPTANLPLSVQFFYIFYVIFINFIRYWNHFQTKYVIVRFLYFKI